MQARSRRLLVALLLRLEGLVQARPCLAVPGLLLVVVPLLQRAAVQAIPFRTASAGPVLRLDCNPELLVPEGGRMLVLAR